jgi:hypothetical protein
MVVNLEDDILMVGDFGVDILTVGNLENEKIT